MVGAKTLLGFVKCQKYWLCYGWSRYPSARPSDVDYLLACKSTGVYDSNREREWVMVEVLTDIVINDSAAGIVRPGLKVCI